MTVRQLREALSDFDQDAYVVVRDPDWGLINVKDLRAEQDAEVFQPSDPFLYGSYASVVEVLG